MLCSFASQFFNRPVALLRSVSVQNKKAILVCPGGFAMPLEQPHRFFKHGFEAAAIKRETVQMNVQFPLRQYLQPRYKGLLAFAFDSYKKSRSFFDDLMRHRSADMRHSPKLAGEIFFHKARFTPESFDFASTINA